MNRKSMTLHAKDTNDADEERGEKSDKKDLHIQKIKI